ncbi:uncharacterized protein LOC123471199 [Daphnia magna]|uniref:uncharacterized protein LOC123471199 n=1 Tax=Daphnia magna TaxID=35525 RepID=UPI001E1BA906|nr:uncharacterized protein LOC123471199 [Daphnia magna]
MDDLTNNTAARIAATARSQSVSPSIPVAAPVLEEAAQAVAIDSTSAAMAQWTRLRTTTRRQITNTCSQITTAIRRGDPGDSVQALAEYAQELLRTASDLNNRLLEEAGLDEFDRQHEAHTRYVQQVKAVAAELQRYLTPRAHPPSVRNGHPAIVPSVYSSRQSSAVHPEADRPQSHTEAQQRVLAAQQDLQEAERALQSLRLEDNDLEYRSLPGVVELDAVNRWCQDNRRWGAVGEASLQEEAPDDWIDMYRAGRLRPLPRVEAGPHSSIRAELPDYSGKALDWFAWIDLFRALVHDTSKAAGEKFAILRRHLQGDCLDVVYGLGGEAAYIQALVRLKDSFGRRDVMRAAHIQALEKLEFQKNDPASFKRYAEKVRTHLFDLTRIGEFAAADIIERICLKLQLADRLAWNTDRGSGLERRSLDQFGSWLCNRAAAYQNAYSIAADQTSGVPGKARDRQHTRTNQVQGETRGRDNRQPNSSYCFNCEGSHKLEDCPSFKGLTARDKLSFCSRRRLCFNCLKSGHSARDCRMKKSCSVPNCNRTHHALLHYQPDDADESVRPATARTNLAKGKKAAVGMIQLDVLDAEGKPCESQCVPQTLAVDGAGGVLRKYTSRRIQLRVRLPTGEFATLQGSTMPTVASPVPLTDWNTLKKRWRHLADLPLESNGGRVDILLGIDQAYLTTAIESRFGQEDEPTAIRTRLGWVVRGVIGNTFRNLMARTHAVFTSMEEEGDALAQQMKRFCDTEEFGTEHKTDGVSEDDRQAIDILESGTRKLAVGYETPITWKVGEPDLPNNRHLAERRLATLLHRFNEEPDFGQEYRKAMEKNFEKGYAIVLAPADYGPPEYYLAHHGVRKGPKLRVVFDAAAPFKGKCLNDSILSGPALQTPLPSVILKFREGEIAWAADIEAMFSRIRLRPEDARYFRFLWKRNGEEKVCVCEMKRLPFGATCSPFIAISTTRKIAADLSDDPKVIEAINTRMYVDDYLSSAKSLEEGIQEAVGVKETLAKGDMHLQSWISNSAAFVKILAPTSKGVSQGPAELPLSKDDSEKVLGVYWNPNSDTLKFRVSGLEEITYTRVGIATKIKLRELGTKGLQWNDLVSSDDRDWWEEWFSVLQQLNDIDIPRCLFPDEENITRSELHAFGDASEEAYAAVIYIRNVYSDGRVLVRHVRASTKLAPKRSISVPKLELNAALQAARLARSVIGAFTRIPHRRYFWTDSSTVRNWIRATASKYQMFVSHRVGEIQTLTQPDEWRFVPGKMNTADIATRSAIEEEALPSRWWDGPKFLQDDEETWPADLPWIAVVEEIRPVRSHQATVTTSTFDWESVKIGVEDIPDLVRLEKVFYDLVKRCQSEVYSEEIRRLKKGKWLQPNSSLLSLCPVLGKDGLLRLGGRAGRAKLPYEELHPPLLPAQHSFTKTIVRAFHVLLKHVGTDYQISYIRQHFWIPGGRELVKRIRHECEKCKRERAKPGEQLMAELPDSRLESGSAPFTRTACDLFGPLEVGLSRNRTAKRWAVLYTCLVTRAVYVDLVNSLSSDDFLLSLRRFIGLYGKPRVMHSDNGTNFVGAENELKEEAEKLYADEKVAEFLNLKRIDWRFQPPRTPHFGGAHESLSKKLRHPAEDTLRTLLYEVAGLLNGRPLTAASTDPNDFRPLTPNDFLNRPSSADPPAGTFDDALPREHYRYVQRMANLFWDLWKKVYLQSLAGRKKWKSPLPNFKVGDVVLEIDKSLRRGQWNIGRIAKVFPGPDGLVRVVDVQLERGLFRRGIDTLALLEVSSAGDVVPDIPASGEDVPAKN